MNGNILIIDESEGDMCSFLAFSGIVFKNIEEYDDVNKRFNKVWNITEELKGNELNKRKLQKNEKLLHSIFNILKEKIEEKKLKLAYMIFSKKIINIYGKKNAKTIISLINVLQKQKYLKTKDNIKAIIYKELYLWLMVKLGSLSLKNDFISKVICDNKSSLSTHTIKTAAISTESAKNKFIKDLHKIVPHKNAEKIAENILNDALDDPSSYDKLTYENILAMVIELIYNIDFSKSTVNKIYYKNHHKGFKKICFKDSRDHKLIQVADIMSNFLVASIKYIILKEFAQSTKAFEHKYNFLTTHIDLNDPIIAKKFTYNDGNVLINTDDPININIG